MTKPIGLALALALAAASCTKQKPRALAELDDWTEALERSSATAPNLCELADAKAARFRAAGGAEARARRFLALCRTRPAEWARAELAASRAAAREPDCLLLPLAVLEAAPDEPLRLAAMSACCDAHHETRPTCDRLRAMRPPRDSSGKDM